MADRMAGWWTPLIRVPFLLCLLVLGSAAVVAGPAAKWAGISLIKEAVPLRKPLDEMRKDDLGPYRFKEARTLPATIIAALGTDVYVSRVYEDTRKEDTRKKVNSPLRYVDMTVTYYSGGANQVPHTADLCMVGSGYQLKQKPQNLNIPVTGLGPGPVQVPICVQTFVKSSVQYRAEPTVIYTFHGNGQFTASRNGLRLLITDPRDKYAYFSKVEISFGSGQGGGRNPTREQSIEAAREFLSHVLPLLVKEHWPDWEAVKAAEKAN